MFHQVQVSIYQVLIILVDIRSFDRSREGSGKGVISVLFNV